MPNGQGGYIVLDRPGCTLANATRWGHGCPAPTAAYDRPPRKGRLAAATKSRRHPASVSEMLR